MKKLVGQIFRDENGVETIEHVKPDDRRILWQIETEEDFSNKHPYQLNLTCPWCRKKQVSRFSTKQVRDQYVDTLKTVGRYTYCGYCGAHNILQEVITWWR